MGAAAGMIALAVVIMWQVLNPSPTRDEVPQPTPIPRDALVFGAAPTLGSRNAKIGIVEFSDFQCPFCAIVATLLFARPRQPSESAFVESAKDIGLDTVAFEACRTLQSVRELVEQDRRQGETLGVTGTPTLFFGRTERSSIRVTDVLVGARPISEFQEVLNRLMR